MQAFLKAIHFYRQEKGHYESWDMLVGTDCQVGYSQACFDEFPEKQCSLLLNESDES